MKVLVILSPGFEETEAITAIDLLRRARIDTVTASLEENQTVVGSHGIPVVADAALSDYSVPAGAPPSDDSPAFVSNVLARFDALVLPGGMRGVTNMCAEPAVLALTAGFAQAGKYIAAVCAAPLILLHAGVLSGHEFTCHPCIFDRIEAAGFMPSLREQPAVTDGHIVTGRSAGCALKWAIELVKTLSGSDESFLGGLAIL